MRAVNFAQSADANTPVGVHPQAVATNGAACACIQSHIVPIACAADHLSYQDT